MKRRLFLTTALLLSFGLAGCGGGGGTESTPTTLTGQFVDAPVANLEYETSSGITGRTDSNGYFKYRPGDTVTFKVGKVVIGETTGQELVTLVDLVADDIVDSGNAVDPTALQALVQKKVKLISAFLLSLDKGTADDVIEIDDTEIEKLEKVEDEVNLEKIEIGDNADITTLIADLPIPEDLKPEIEEKLDEAEAHLIDNVYKPLKNTLEFLNGKTVSFKFKDEPNMGGTCTFSIDNTDDSTKTITGRITNCVGSGLEDDTITFKVEGGIPLLVEGDGTTDTIIELEGEELCIVTSDSGVVCIKPFEEDEHEEHTEFTETTFVPAPLNIEAFKDRKIIFNGGKSYLILYSNGSFELKDIEDSGDGKWEYDQTSRSIVLWPGQPYEYRVRFSSAEPEIGTKMEISHEGGEKVRYDKIVRIENVLYENVLKFLTMADGKKVAFYDDESPLGEDTCEVEVNPNNPSQFKMVNCTRPADNDDDWETVKVDDEGKVVIIDENGAVTQVTSIIFPLKEMWYEVKDEGIKGYIKILD